MVIVHASHIVRVAAHILAGPIDGVDGKAFNSGKGLRQKGSLDQFCAMEVFVNDIGLCAEHVAGLF